MRRKNLKPTLIYWLYDIRPETITAGWVTGKPIYCGKTVQGLRIRFLGHRADAKRYSRKLGPAFLECGEYVEIRLIETVILDADWPARECFWITQLRAINPNCLNVSNGGFGMTGYVATAATREKQRVANLGKKHSPETRERLRLVKLGTTHGPEARRKLSEFNKGKTVSAETREKMRVLKTGRKHTAETRAKMSESACSRIRKPHSEETKRKIGDRHRGRKHSPDFGKRISEMQKGRQVSVETRNKMAEAHRGQKRSVEACKNMNEAMYRSYERRKQATLASI